MSCADDKDFVLEMIDKSERYIAGEMPKVLQEIKMLKSNQVKDAMRIQELTRENTSLNEKVDKLTNEVETLKKERASTVVLKTMEHAFRAGLHTVMATSGALDITPAKKFIGLPN